MAAFMEDLPASPPASPGVIEEALMAMEAGADQSLISAQHFEAGWRQHRSANSGRLFYYNVTTHESRWDLPLLPPGEPQAVPQPSAAVSQPPRSASAPAALGQPATNQPSRPASNQSASSSSASTEAVVGIPDAEDRDVGARFHLGGKRYVVVKRFKGQPYINIREYYQPKDRVPGRLFAGKKGINLTADQWHSLCKHVGAIKRALTTMTRQGY